MKNYRLLSATLALVLVAGLATPAFAQEFAGPQYAGPDVHLPPIDEVNEIYDNGRGDEIFGGPPIQTNVPFWADDFVLDQDNVLTDIHFDGFFLYNPTTGTPLKQFEYTIYADNEDTPGSPGDVIQSGQGINEGQMFIESLDPGFDVYRFWFDLDIPLELTGGETYWIALQANPDPFTEISWLAHPDAVGNTLHTLSMGDWVEHLCLCDFNFILTGDSLVGGELLPIDSTSLILAGAQSFTFMIPVLVSAIGIGLFAVSRKS